MCADIRINALRLAGILAPALMSDKKLKQLTVSNLRMRKIK